MTWKCESTSISIEGAPQLVVGHHPPCHSAFSFPRSSSAYRVDVGGFTLNHIHISSTVPKWLDLCFQFTGTLPSLCHQAINVWMTHRPRAYPNHGNAMNSRITLALLTVTLMVIVADVYYVWKTRRRSTWSPNGQFASYEKRPSSNHAKTLVPHHEALWEIIYDSKVYE